MLHLAWVPIEDLRRRVGGSIDHLTTLVHALVPGEIADVQVGEPIAYHGHWLCCPVCGFLGTLGRHTVIVSPEGRVTIRPDVVCIGRGHMLERLGYVGAKDCCYQVQSSRIEPQILV